MNMTLLSIQNIDKSFGSRHILKNISFSLEQGEFVSVVGKSGSGKSTLFNIIAGLEPTDGGDIILNGRSIKNKAGEVSYMLQKDLLFPYYTVLDNVILPLVIRGEKKSQAREKASAFFSEFGLEGTQNQYPSQLSGGMRQRAALLRTFLSTKEVMLLDEPFSALDMITKNQMHEWYSATMERHRLSTLLITHDIEEALLLSERILILENTDEGKDTNLIKEVKVLQSRPRNREFIFTKEFSELKQELWQAVLPQ